MAVRPNTWANSDGLRVQFGSHASDNEVFAEVAKQGFRRVYQGYIDLLLLVNTYADTNYPSAPQEAVIPRGSLLTRGSLQAVVGATSGTSSTMDIGMWSRGVTTEVVDTTNGICAAITNAELGTIGETHILNGTMIVAAGASTAITVGATANSPCVIAPSYNTVFTAGQALLTLEFQVPWGPAGAAIAV